MKCLIVHRTDKGFLGEEITWRSSGSGQYRETSALAIPQNEADIIKFARENSYSIEWRDLQHRPQSATA